MTPAATATSVNVPSWLLLKSCEGMLGLPGVVSTSYLVAAIGAGAILIINVMSPGVTKDMTSAPEGIAGLVVAGVLWTIAFVAIKRTTKVDV